MKLMQGLVIVSALVATPTMAQAVTYACQYIESAGLEWKGGEWKPTRFHLQQPFFLKTENGSLTPKSVKKVFIKDERLLASANLPVCTATVDAVIINQACIDDSGWALSFSTDTLSGATAGLYGGSQSKAGSLSKADEPKDSLWVSPFVCTVM